MILQASHSRWLDAVSVLEQAFFALFSTNYFLALHISISNLKTYGLRCCASDAGAQLRDALRVFQLSRRGDRL